MERATKLLVFVWACVVLAADVHFASRAWGGIVPMSIGAFVFGAMLGALSRRNVAIVLVLTYVFPVVIRQVSGGFDPFFMCPWMAGLLGLLIPDGFRSGWHLPARWRGPLVCWALIIAVGTPIVVWRELDFNLTTIDWPGYVWNSSGGAGPRTVVPWIVNSALVSMLGILWFDWLFGSRREDFRDRVVAPLLVSCSLMAAVAGYQLFGNIWFLNETLFGGMGRASGTLFDANVCGMIAALWVAGAVIWAEPLEGRRAWLLWPLLLLIGTAVWASGSRTAFAVAVVTGAFGLVAFVSGGAGSRMRRLGALLAAGLAAGIVIALAARGTAVGPIARMTGMLPRLSLDSIGTVLAELWNRNRYGEVATAMFRKFPWFGVGIGSFQDLMPDFAAGFERTLAVDNAQNWYRHQLVELGIVGSIGWMVWAFRFAPVLVRPSAAPARLSAWTTRGALLGFALISLVGMPAQDLTVTITFWTLAYWLSAPGSDEARGRAPLTRRSWLLILAVVVLYAGGTSVMAATRLRVPRRSQAAGWPYSYGFYDPETDPAGGEYRWTAARATAVIPAPSRWLMLEIGVDHREMAARPVDVKVWCDGKLVIADRLQKSDTLTRYVFLSKQESWVMIETWTNRVSRPSDTGGTDNRELGLKARWRFVAAPPQGAVMSQ